MNKRMKYNFVISLLILLINLYGGCKNDIADLSKGYDYFFIDDSHGTEFTYTLDLGSEGGDVYFVFTNSSLESDSAIPAPEIISETPRFIRTSLHAPQETPPAFKNFRKDNL